MAGWKLEGMGGWEKKKWAKVFQKELLLQTLNPPSSNETIYCYSIVVPMAASLLRGPAQPPSVNWGSSRSKTPVAGGRQRLKGGMVKGGSSQYLSLISGFPEADLDGWSKEVAGMHIRGIFLEACLWFYSSPWVTYLLFFFLFQTAGWKF